MKIAFIVGEHSSDRLGAALIRALRGRLGSETVEPVGLGGDAMAAEGLRSLFDIDELSIIGVGAVVARLPRLVRRLRQIERAILAAQPDALVLIDNYSFSHRVARRVRAAAPALPVVNYVPPAVWAYHDARAAAMRGYVDRVISVFPFEPAVYARLGGPPATYVGHPLIADPHLATIMAERDGNANARPPNDPPTLLLLPGSRRGEIDRLLAPFIETLAALRSLVPNLRARLPAVPRLAERIKATVAASGAEIEIVSGDAAKWDAFAGADAALAASGTVALELALAGVPTALAYKLDPVTYRLRHHVTAWTAALPNFISGHPLVPEHFHEFVRPELLARRLHRLVTDTPERRAQLEGFDEVRNRMRVGGDPADKAAGIVLDAIVAKRRAR